MSTLESCLLDINELISQKQYAEALSRLQTLESDTVQRLDPLAMSGVFYRYAKCLYHLGEYSASLDKLNAAISISRVGTDHVLYAHQKQLLGFICRATGQADEAVQAFLESYAARLRAEDFQSIYASLVNLGLSHMLKGDLQQGCVWFANALKYAEQYNTPEEVAICKINLCLLALLRGDFSRVHEVVRSIDTKALTEINKARVVELRGKFAVYQFDFASAETNLNEALNHHRKASVQRDHVVCLEYLGMNEFFQGNYAKAREYYQQVLATQEPTASAVAQTLRMLTDVYIAEGNWKEAKETAVAAEAAITKINERIELAALWRAQAQISEHDRDHDVARDFFQKSIDLLQQCGARYELAVTYLAMGQTRYLATDLKKERLQQAKALFVEMDVPKRVSQVEKVIVGLISVKPQPKVFRGGKSSIETPDIITQDPEMVRILADAVKFAATDMTILITGETGTGKDLLAKYIHFHSRRAAGPFCNENMSRFPRELIDSELFGYEKGSHSRADRNKAGVIELADGGTFCLNEVAELPLDMQTRLLLVIEEGTVRRVGGGEPRPVDVRFVAMTNGDLKERVEARLFRQDLFYRLQDFHLHLPPLRDRLDDLPLLVQHFLRQLDFADYDLRQSMLIVEQCGFAVYDWPGNVRELRGVLKKAATLSSSRLLAELVGRLKVRMDQLSMIDSDNAERAKFLAALKRNSGCQTSAAKELGIPVSTLRNKLRKYRII